MKRTFLGSMIVMASVMLAGLEPVEAVQVQRVTFESQGQTVVGNLYLPDDYQPDQPLPGVVVTGAWTSVKEQMVGTYAEELAERGYAALAFDFRGWGESLDSLMFLEDPERKTEDVMAAVDFLASRPEVDASRIAGLGICASAGYMADAALQSDTLKSVALVAPWLHNSDIVNAVYGGLEGVNQLIAASRQAVAKFQTTGQMTVVPAASTTDETAIMQQAPYYTDPERGFIPEYDNQFNIATWEPWLTYDAIATADHLEKPTLLIHSESAAIPQGAEEFADRMGELASTIWFDDTTQLDFYDNPEVVQRSSDLVAQHFKTTLEY